MTRPHRHAYRIGAIRLLFKVLGALLLVLLGAGSVLPALHYVVVRHEICAQHGELRHADEGTHAVHADSASAHDSELLASDPGHDGDHEHCGVQATTEPRGTLSETRTLELVPAVTEAPALLQAAAHAHTSISVLSYAPKLAPPV